MRNWSVSLAIALCASSLNLTSFALAQTKNTASGCATAEKAEPATPPDRQSADGTAPGNTGSTGWTGGTGGVHIGTNPQGGTEDSVTWQPPTARGLDLAMAPETAQQKDCKNPA